MTAKHQRGSSVLRLLARLNWQRDPDSWTVRCHDGRGRRARLRVGLAPTGVMLSPSRAGSWVLTPLQVGRLRAAVRDAVLAFDQLARVEQDGHDTPDASHPRIEPPPAAADREVHHDDRHAAGHVAHDATLAS